MAALSSSSSHFYISFAQSFAASVLFFTLFYLVDLENQRQMCSARVLNGTIEVN